MAVRSLRFARYSALTLLALFCLPSMHWPFFLHFQAPKVLVRWPPADVAAKSFMSPALTM